MDWPSLRSTWGAKTNGVVLIKRLGVLQDRERRVPGATASRRPGLRGGRVPDNDGCAPTRRLIATKKTIKRLGVLKDRERRVPGATASRRPGLRGGRVPDHDVSGHRSLIGCGP